MSAVRLSPLDNVVVLSRSVDAGTTIEVEGRRFTAATRLGLGHKLAFQPISAGEKILKYGASIGSATHGRGVAMTVIRDDAFLRADGCKGIRNTVAVVYLVECAHHVAREIQLPFREADVHLIGFGGCYANTYSFRMLKALCTHPNVGAVLLVSLGCEGFNRRGLLQAIRDSGRPADTLVIQENGGTRSTIDAGPPLGRGCAAAARSDTARPDGGRRADRGHHLRGQ